MMMSLVRILQDEKMGMVMGFGGYEGCRERGGW